MVLNAVAVVVVFVVDGCGEGIGEASAGGWKALRCIEGDWHDGGRWSATC